MAEKASRRRVESAAESGVTGSLHTAKLLSRGSDPFQEVGVRIGAVAFVALVAGVVLGWAPLIPAAAALAGGLYAAEFERQAQPYLRGLEAISSLGDAAVQQHLTPKFL